MLAANSRPHGCLASCLAFYLNQGLDQQPGCLYKKVFDHLFHYFFSNMIFFCLAKIKEITNKNVVQLTSLNYAGFYPNTFVSSCFLSKIQFPYCLLDSVVPWGWSPWQTTKGKFFEIQEDFIKMTILIFPYSPFQNMEHWNLWNHWNFAPKL